MNEDLNNPTTTCPVTGKRNIDLCVPVSVIPFAEVGKIITKCVGKPTVENGNCKGKANEHCDFIIKQTISVEVPVEFGAKVTTGETFVVCGKLSEDEDNDNNCDEDEDNDSDEDEDENEDEDEDNQNENNKRMSFFGR